MTELVISNGGRSAAGFKGETDDCTCRAVAIVTGEAEDRATRFVKEGKVIR